MGELDMNMKNIYFLKNVFQMLTVMIINPASIWTYQEMCINYLELRRNRGNPYCSKELSRYDRQKCKQVVK